MRVSQVNSPEG